MHDPRLKLEVCKFTSRVLNADSLKMCLSEVVRVGQARVTRITTCFCSEHFTQVQKTHSPTVMLLLSQYLSIRTMPRPLFISFSGLLCLLLEEAHQRENIMYNM